MEASVTSTEIGSYWGSANKGLVGVESSVWDSSPAPKEDWDAMLNNCEKMESESWTSVWEKYESFTWATAGLVLWSLFLVVAFWVTPGTTLRFGDCRVTIVGAEGVLINFFNEGAVDPILETRHDGW